MNKFKITIDENNFDVTVNVTVYLMKYHTKAKTRLLPPHLVNLLPYRLQLHTRVPLKVHLQQVTRLPTLKHRFPERFPLLA